MTNTNATTTTTTTTDAVTTGDVAVAVIVPPVGAVDDVVPPVDAVVVPPVGAADDDVPPVDAANIVVPPAIAATVVVPLVGATVALGTVHPIMAARYTAEATATTSTTITRTKTTGTKTTSDKRNVYGVIKCTYRCTAKNVNEPIIKCIFWEDPKHLKSLHRSCYKDKILYFNNLNHFESHNLYGPYTTVACTKTCHSRAMKLYTRDPTTANLAWTADGPNGINDEVCSKRIFVYWLTTKGNYTIIAVDVA